MVGAPVFGLAGSVAGVGAMVARGPGADQAELLALALGPGSPLAAAPGSGLAGLASPVHPGDLGPGAGAMVLG